MTYASVYSAPPNIVHPIHINSLNADLWEDNLLNFGCFYKYIHSESPVSSSCLFFFCSSYTDIVDRFMVW